MINKLGITISSEEVERLWNSPRQVKLRDLRKKVRSGTATSDERAEFDAMMKRTRDLDPNVLVD